MRIKTFADSVAVPMSNVILEIYKQSAASLRESDVYFNKRQQLSEWREKFVARAQERLNNLYNQMSDELDSAISDFVYYHCEDKNAGANWQSRFQSLKFYEKYQGLLKSLAEEYERKRTELSNELAKELPYIVDKNTRVSIHLDDTTPWGQRGSLLLGGVGGVILSTALRTAFGPIGWGLTAVGLIGSLLFDSKEKQRQQNREKLRDAITPKSYEVLNKMHDEVIDTLNNKILAEGVDGLYNSLCGRQFMLARLGESQYNMAATLFGEFSDLNFKLLVEANNYKGVGSGNVNDIMRIPGEKMLILADRSNLDTKKLSDLLGESVSIMKPEENFPDTLKKVLDSYYDVDYYPLDFTEENKEPEEAIALFPKKKVDATKFKLAQQFAGCPIIAEFTQSASRDNDFKADFAEVDALLNGNKDMYAIKTKLMFIRRKAENQRDAAAMRKIAVYYDKAMDSGTGYSCRREANNF